MSDDELISVPKSVLQAVLDSAVGSMDYGSGFLDEEEVSALRDVAVLLGVDPWTVTPSNVACAARFGVGHKMKKMAANDWRRRSYPGAEWVCSACGVTSETEVVA